MRPEFGLSFWGKFSLKFLEGIRGLKEVFHRPCVPRGGLFSVKLPFLAKVILHALPWPSPPIKVKKIPKVRSRRCVASLVKSYAGMLIL
jgi:hypothetical protein